MSLHPEREVEISSVDDSERVGRDELGDESDSVPTDDGRLVLKVTNGQLSNERSLLDELDVHAATGEGKEGRVRELGRVLASTAVKLTREAWRW